MQAFILAGGFATRLWPLTEKRAKPLLPLEGKPILTHLLEKIPQEIPVTVSTNAAFVEGFEEWKTSAKRENLRLLVESSRKDEQKAGALGAIAEWITKEGISEDILVLTGDNYLGFSLKDFLSAYRSGIPILAAYDVLEKSKASHFGTVLIDSTDSRRIIGFEEKPKEPKTTLVSTGCSILPKEVLSILIEFAAVNPDNLGGIFEELVRRNLPVDCFTFTDPWLDIGSFHSYLEAHRLLVGQKTLLEPSASLKDSTCEGSVVIGKGSTVERSMLVDCIVFEDCHIKDCVMQSCIVDNHCILEGVDLTKKMLRTGTVLRLSKA